MPQVKINKEQCKGCSLCIYYCPKKNIELCCKLDLRGVKVAQIIDKNNCTGCRFCVLMCPDSCIEVYK